MSPDLLAVVWQIFAVAMGLTLGSFANVSIDRSPHDHSLFHPSACDHCNTRLQPYELVPIASWVWLRGRCRTCGGAISARMPLIELLMGCLSWLLYTRFVGLDQPMPTPGALAAWATFLCFTLLLVIATYVDIRHRIIPDHTSFLAVPVGVAGLFAMEILGYQGWLGIGWRQGVIGALFCGGLFTAFALSARALQGSEALGWGDVKLWAMVGSFVGAFPGGLLVMMSASLWGAMWALAMTLVQQRRLAPPQAPNIALMAILWVLVGDTLVERVFPGMAFFLPGV